MKICLFNKILRWYDYLRYIIKRRRIFANAFFSEFLNQETTVDSIEDINNYVSDNEFVAPTQDELEQLKYITKDYNM